MVPSSALFVRGTYRARRRVLSHKSHAVAVRDRTKLRIRKRHKGCRPGRAEGTAIPEIKRGIFRDFVQCDGDVVRTVLCNKALHVAVNQAWKESNDSLRGIGAQRNGVRVNGVLNIKLKEQSLNDTSR